MIFEHRSIFAGVVGAARRGAVAMTIPVALLAPGAVSHAQDTIQAPPGAPVPGESITVHLLTVGPGDRVEEMWGHNAILIRDTAAGLDEAYNYGIFDPNAPGFLLDFFKGESDYEVRSVNLDSMLAAYGRAGRRVWAQELTLAPAAKLELLGLLRTVTLPRNRFYRYNYYLNNCSTKVRDVLDTVLNGQLSAATDDTPGGGTWRYQTRRLAAAGPLVYLGIQLFMGPRGDEPTTGWDDMWIPMKLRDTAGALTVTGSDGNRVPLVRSEEIWVDAPRDYAAIAPPRLDLLFLLLGLLTGVVLSLLGYGARAGGRGGRTGLILFGCAWGLFCLAASALMVTLYWTDHSFTYWNQNILLFSPLGVGVAVGLTRVAAKGTTSVWGRRFVLASLGLAAVALLLNLVPLWAQGNREMIAFALPVQLAACWVMLGINRMENSLVYN